MFIPILWMQKWRHQKSKQDAWYYPERKRTKILSSGVSGSRLLCTMLSPQSNFWDSNKSFRAEYIVIMPTEKMANLDPLKTFPFLSHYFIWGVQVSTKWTFLHENSGLGLQCSLFSPASRIQSLSRRKVGRYWDCWKGYRKMLLTTSTETSQSFKWKSLILIFN